MTKSTLYIALLITSFFAAGQPGYLGKKNWVEANALLFSALSNPTVNKAQEDELLKNSFHINKTLAISYHRVLNRKRALGFVYNYDATGMYWQPTLYQESQGSYGNSYPYGNRVNVYNGKGEVPDLKVKTHMIGISHLRYIKKLGNIAPIGFYTEWELLYSTSTIHDEKFDDKIESFGLGYIGFGFGVRKVIAQRLTFNIGIKTRLSSYIAEAFYHEGADPIAFLDDSYGSYNEDSYDYEYELKNTAKNRVTKKQLINFSIGVGYLF